MEHILPYIVVGLLFFYLGVHYYRGLVAKEKHKEFKDFIKTTEAKYASTNKKDDMTVEDWRKVYQIIREHKSNEKETKDNTCS